jgi:hypothetical protein
MPDDAQNHEVDPHPEVLTRREGVKLAAALLALGAGLGVPREALGLAPAAARLQVKFYRGIEDGGALLGSVDLADPVTAFLASPAGARTQIKWFDATAGDLGSMPIPLMIQEKVRALNLRNPGD